MPVPALCPVHALQLTLPLTGRRPSTVSAADITRHCSRLHRYNAAVRLLIRVHAHRSAVAFMGRSGVLQDTDEISQVPTKGRHHVHMGSTTARGSSSASLLRGEDVAFRPAERRQHLEIRPVSQLNIPARGLPCERFKLALAGSPCITRGRRGWLGLTP